MLKRISLGDLSLILILTIIQPILILVGGTDLPVPLQIVRAVVGLGYLLFIPGYCLQAAAFPSRLELDGKERLALSLGLSLAIIPSLALILDRLPWRINVQSVTIGLFITTLLLLFIAVFRRMRVNEDERLPSYTNKKIIQSWRSMEGGMKIAYTLLGAVILIAGFTAIAILVLPKPAARMTEFYILGSEGKAELYPREVVVNQPVSVILGIRNLEGQDERYRVVIKDGSGVLWDTQSFFLPADGVVESPISFMPRETGENVDVIFNLYREGQSEPYRVLRLLLEVQSAP